MFYDAVRLAGSPAVLLWAPWLAGSSGPAVPGPQACNAGGSSARSSLTLALALAKPGPDRDHIKGVPHPLHVILLQLQPVGGALAGLVRVCSTRTYIQNVRQDKIIQSSFSFSHWREWKEPLLDSYVSLQHTHSTVKYGNMIP